MIHSFLKKKLALSWRAPQENDAKFRFPIHVQGIRLFHDNCKIAKCQIVATLAPVYTFDNTPVTDTSSTSYLGVELSPDLRWNKQVKKTVAKGNQTLGVLKRNLGHSPRSIKDMAYKTILRPKLEYASAV